MAKKHICLKCGGTEFITPAHVAQDWKVDAEGSFLEVVNDCTDIDFGPDDGNIWQCADCGAEGVIAQNSLVQCSAFMARLISKHYSTKTWCLDTDAILETADAIYGRPLVAKVIAYTLRNHPHDGRIDHRNKAWAEQEVPAPVSRDDLIDFDLTCRGAHIGLVNLLANYVRKGGAEEKRRETELIC